MGEDGGTEINFGILPVAFSPQAGDDGYIYGRAWIDSNGSGYPEPNEAPLNGSTVRLLDAAGNEIATHITGSSWYYGSYAFRITTPGEYRVQMDAPPGVFPASRSVTVNVADLRVVSAQLPFLAGGTIGGQVSNASGVGTGGATLTLQPGNLQRVTAADGSYSFSGLADGSYTLQLNPPTNTVTPDSVTQRFVPVTLNGSAVENWTLLKKGQLTIKAVQVVNGLPLPISFLFFEVLLNGSQVRLVNTNAQGEALVEGLAPGTYTVRPWDEIANIIPGLQLTPAERTAVVSNDSAATLSFTGTLSRSLNLYCQLAGAFGQGFACNYEVRTLSGSLIDFGNLPADQPATSNWNLNPATLEVRLIPDPDVPGQESWPTYSQIVVIADNTHVDVRYPFNPTNPQTIAGYAYWDRCRAAGYPRQRQLLHREQRAQQQRHSGGTVQRQRRGSRQYGDGQRHTLEHRLLQLPRPAGGHLPGAGQPAAGLRPHRWRAGMVRADRRRRGGTAGSGLSVERKSDIGRARLLRQRWQRRI